jgi:hypothetical protein
VVERTTEPSEVFCVSVTTREVEASWPLGLYLRMISSVRVPSVLTTVGDPTGRPFKSVVIVFTTDCPVHPHATNAKAQYFTIPA